MDINYILFITIKEIGNDNENTIEIQYIINLLWDKFLNYSLLLQKGILN